MITFTAGEVFEMAVQIERNGVRFYREAAEFSTDSSKALLLTLAEMEEIHEKVFSDLRNELSESEKKSISSNPNDQGMLYLRAMVEGRIFQNDVSREALASMTLEDILKLAISLEKDSIIFYQCIKERAIATPETGERIEVIIQQEIGHILELTKQLNILEKAG